jgi:TonB family protein
LTAAVAVSFGLSAASADQTDNSYIKSGASIVDVSFAGTLARAQKGDAAAQYDLGAMYHEGRGVPQDYVQAHKWYNLAGAGAAIAQLRDSAIKNRNEVAAKMQQNQIAEAQRLASEWRPRGSLTGERTAGGAAATAIVTVRAPLLMASATGGRSTDKAIGYVNAAPKGSFNVLVDADYPAASRLAEEEGVTQVSYVVGVDGRVSQCEILQSSGFQTLDDATCAIITRRFRFNPATLNGKPVPERKIQPARWRLTN